MGGLCLARRKLIAESGLLRRRSGRSGRARSVPACCRSTADGAPLMNAVLYGVDTRAAREIEELTASIGAETIFARCGNALTSQSVGPKILWLKRNRPDIYARAHKFLNSTSFLVHRLTGRFVTDHYTAANASPLYLIDEQTWTSALAPDITRTRIGCRNSPGRPKSPAASRARAAEQTGLAAGNAGHRRHDRRGGRGDQRRRSRCRRYDADVRLDDLHHPHRQAAFE